MAASTSTRARAALWKPLAASALLALGSLSGTAHADADAIRKALSERITQLKDIDEVRATPMQGLFEVRKGTDLFYTNASGDFLIQGELYDTKAMRNLTEDRINALTAVEFSKLPFDDAFTIVRGDGSRKIAVFADPNCGYCKRFERDLRNVDNITVHVFLYPILSPDSFEKSRDVWCAEDKATAWNSWMIHNKTPASQASCDKHEALQRNLAFGRQYKITGTPTIFFEDNARVPGAVPAERIEQRFKEIAESKKKS